MRLLIVFLLLGAGAGAQSKADPFAAWWKEFQAAVARKDAAVVSRNARFPMQWENGPNRDIKTAADIAARFDFYFTAEIKQKVAKSKPKAGQAGEYSITWKARGNEYSLYFKDSGKGYALDGLSEGPP